MEIRLIRKNEERLVDSTEKAEKLEAEGFRRLNGFQGREETENKRDISEMTVAELRSLAKEKKLEGYSSLSKEELLSVLGGQ